ncbi:unnamed protein product, partial [Polarella glacialis]
MLQDAHNTLDAMERQTAELQAQLVGEQLCHDKSGKRYPNPSALPTNLLELTISGWEEQDGATFTSLLLFLLAKLSLVSLGLLSRLSRLITRTSSELQSLIVLLAIDKSYHKEPRKGKLSPVAGASEPGVTMFLPEDDSSTMVGSALGCGQMGRMTSCSDPVISLQPSPSAQCFPPPGLQPELLSFDDWRKMVQHDPFFFLVQSTEDSSRASCGSAPHGPEGYTASSAGIAGGPCGAHATVQAIYFYWNDSGMYGPVVYGLLAGNRSRWCFDPSSCKIFYTTFCVLCIVSWVTQYFVYVAEKQGKPWKAYAPVPFKHPNAGTVFVGAGLVRDGAESSEDEEEEDLLFSDCTGQDDSWAQNLTTPRSCWVFLTVVVAFSCAATFAFTYLVKWDEPTETNYFFGLVYILANAFCLWSIIEFFFTTLWFHTIRLICGMPGLPKQDFSHGLPRNGRTILAYCLLSKSKDSSEETFNTALQAHFANIDPNGRVTTSVVSVSSALSVVQCEMDCRDKGRAEIKRILGGEVVAIQRLFEAGDLADCGHAAKSVIRDALQALPGGSGDRANFWFAVLTNGRKRGTVGGPARMQALLALRLDA